MKGKILRALVIGLSICVFFIPGCKGKTSEGGSESGEDGVSDFATFETAITDFKEVVRFVSVTPDKAMAYDAAKKAEESWGKVAETFPEDPPKQYRGDDEWPDRVTSLKNLMGDIGSAASKEDFTTADAKVREAELLLLELNEANKMNSAGDEAIKILDLADQLEAAFREERFNDAKHIMPSMRTAQKDFFAAPIPDNARDRQDEYDEGKDKVYDAIEAFVEVGSPGERIEKLAELKKLTSEFWVEFG